MQSSLAQGRACETEHCYKQSNILATSERFAPATPWRIASTTPWRMAPRGPHAKSKVKKHISASACHNQVGRSILGIAAAKLQAAIPKLKTSIYMFICVSFVVFLLARVETRRKPQQLLQMRPRLTKPGWKATVQEHEQGFG